MRSTSLPMLPGPWSPLSLALVLPLLVSAQDAPAARDKTVQAREWLEQAGAAVDRCAWADAERLSVWAREGLPYASDAWFDALFHETYALDRLWRPSEMTGCMNLAMAAMSDREREGDQGLGDEYGLPTPGVLGRVLRIQTAGVRVMQSEGRHEQALTYLHGMLDLLQEKRVEDGARLGARVLLDAAWSERSLDHEQEVKIALTELRDHFPGTRDAAIAMVMLQQGLEGAAAYRGKYAGDARHLARIEALRAALPGARKRLAARLGREETALPRCPVGVADVYPGSGQVSAITEVDHHCPSIPPVVIVFSEGLALDSENVESVLVHELCHAVLSIELGAHYAELPVWVSESISQWAAGQWASMPDHALALRLLRAPERFPTPAFWIEEPLRVVEPTCGSGTFESGLALWKRANEPDRAMTRMIARLTTQLPINECLVDFLVVAEHPELAAARGLEFQLQDRRMPSVPLVERIVQAKSQGPGAWLAACDDVLAGKRTPQAPTPAVPGVPHVAQGFALWQRAKALETLARPAEALIAFDELHRRRLEHPTYVENTRIGRVRCLQALGRKEEAQAEARALAFDAFSPEVARWARKQVE